MQVVPRGENGHVKRRYAEGWGHLDGIELGSAADRVPGNKFGGANSADMTGHEASLRFVDCQNGASGILRPAEMPLYPTVVQTQSQMTIVADGPEAAKNAKAAGEVKTRSAGKKRNKRSSRKESTGKAGASMSSWQAGDKPRERLLFKGADALGDAELLAILLGSGAEGLTALQLAHSVIQRFGSLAEVLRRSPHELQGFHGIGDAKSSRLAAAFELSVRLAASELAEELHVRTPQDIARRFIPTMRKLKHERLYVVLLNARGKLMREVLVTEGTLNQSLVHPREVYRSAISESAAAIIVVHNHPSGSWRPSNHDIEATNQLEESGVIIGIPLVDHVIIAGNTFFSMAKAGLLNAVPGSSYEIRTNHKRSSSA